ncbi:Dot/Icm type IV secretion system effector PhnB [soil metagenome]
MSVKPVPQGYEGATPYLCCKDANAALAFYEKAFGAVRTMYLPMPGGKVGHAEIRIAGATIMLSDEFPEMGNVSPETLGGTATAILIYVDDVDAFVEKAEAAGAAILKPVADQFYGDRSAKLIDPSGHVWSFATHIEDVSAEEMEERVAAFTAGS